MARAKLVGRVAAATLRRADTISVCLFLLGIAGLLALPLAGKAIYHDENALLVGHAESVIRCVKTLVTSRLPVSTLLHAHVCMHMCNSLDALRLLAWSDI
jgi:hypothetical protein